MVNDDTIKYWISLANEELGYSDKNDITFNYIKSIQNVAEIIIKDEWYLVMLPFCDMWGNKCLSIISCYVKKECRKNWVNFLKIQRAINLFAKENKIKYIYHGSHFNNDNFLNFLKKNGYKYVVMRKELINGS